MRDVTAAITTPRLSAGRYAVPFVIAVLFGAMIIRVALIASDWNFGDINAYWLAAERLKHGEPLYLGNLSPDSYRVFRYAPWFAWLWVPLTYLPRTLVDWTWAALLVGASAWILVGLARMRSPAGWALAFLMAPWLLSLIQVGNIQPLVVASLAYGISRRNGPLWIGLSASLKAVPILFTLVYLARREWQRIALSVLTMAVLVAPMLLYDISGYTTDPGRSVSFYYYISPLAWAVVAVAATALALVLAARQSPYVWLAVALAVTVSAPRTHVTYVTFLVVGLLAGPADHIGRRADG